MLHPMNAGLSVDAKSAFDVVDHDHMLRRLIHIGVQDKHWTLGSTIHRDALSVVKWFREQSKFLRYTKEYVKVILSVLTSTNSTIYQNHY